MLLFLNVLDILQFHNQVEQYYLSSVYICLHAVEAFDQWLLWQLLEAFKWNILKLCREL